MNKLQQKILLKNILSEVECELEFATAKFGSFASAHEGYSVILEEMDELWDEVKNNKDSGALARQRLEALQVAAMAVRFIMDVSHKP